MHADEMGCGTCRIFVMRELVVGPAQMPHEQPPTTWLMPSSVTMAACSL
jgi:hypothetical protein